MAPESYSKMTPSLASFLASIDFTSVNEAIFNNNLSQADQLGIKDRVGKVIELWLPGDLTADEMLIEESFDSATGGKGIIDLGLRWYEPARSIIVDWKTTGDLKYPSYKWVATANDFQSSMYLATGGDVLEERGWPRPSKIEYRMLDEKGEVRSFIKEADSETRLDIDNHLDGVHTLFSALVDLPAPWPRNRPWECFKGSQSQQPTCPFWKDCVEGPVPPSPEGFDYASKIPRSKSSLKDFLACPERYRRTRICGDVSEESPEQHVGTVFHEAIRRVYELAWAKKQEMRGERGK